MEQKESHAITARLVQHSWHAEATLPISSFHFLCLKIDLPSLELTLVFLTRRA